MMKITVNYIHLSGLVVLGSLVLSGCAPIPQAYAPAPQQQRQVNNVPQAAPLLPGRQRPVAVQGPVAQQPKPVQQQASIAVPPTLQPAQQKAKQAAARQVQQKQQVRRSPVSTYRPPTVRKAPPAVAPAKKRVTPSATKWKPVTPRRAIPRSSAIPSVERQPVTPPVQQRPQQPETPMAQVQKKPVSKVEVLDMSGAAQAPASKAVVEKVVPPPTAYKSSPAVVILTKQANNQLVAGKKDQAASTLERALRIAPDDAMLWLRLAEVNEQQGNKAQAVSMAKKAVGLAPNDATIRQRGSRLIN